MEVHYFIGNHDIWAYDYLEKECGVILHRQPLTTELYGKVFMMDHGDGMLLWDEFNPQLYRLNVDVKTKDGAAHGETVFGMRKMEIRDKMFYVNGRQTILRGTVES